MLEFVPRRAVSDANVECDVRFEHSAIVADSAFQQVGVGEDQPLTAEAAYSR